MLALVLAAAQPAAAQPADDLQIPVCSLVTPGGENVGFFIWSDGARDQVNLTSTEGSVWPARTLVARRPDASNGAQFLIGGSGGFILELAAPPPGGRLRLATLMRSESSRNTYPVAIGGCQDAPPPREPLPPMDGNPIGTDTPAFLPANWPQDCAMLTNQRQIVRFDYTLAGPGGPVRLESAALWGERPVTVRWTEGNGGSHRFGEATGPAGSERLLGTGSTRAKVIFFSRLGETAAPASTGIGICGYASVVRRPNAQ